MTLSPLLEYESPYPLYGISFSNSPYHPHRVALTSLITGPSNKILTVDLNQRGDTKSQTRSQDFSLLSQANLSFPATKVGWEPRESLVNGGQEDQGGRGELLATTGDVLRIWEMTEGWGDDGQRGRGFVGRNGWQDSGGDGYTLSERSVLTNSKSPASSLPPITSFSWNPISPTSIVTCSIDTTATLWDINTSQALTQLIAHDRAVYDLSWLPESSDIFVSVGADGSLRAFDLRTLEHSTILYETTDQTPLARIAFSNREQHMLACFGMDDSKVLILDMRSPGQPVAELVGHQAALGGIAWGSGGKTSGSTSGGWIASCGDDSQVLIYDLTSPLPLDSPPPSNRSSANPKPSSTPTSNLLDPSQIPPRPTGTGTDRSPSPASSSQTVEMMPVRGWTGEAEINNLAFSNEGDWLGCVSGQTLTLLQV